MRSDSYARFFSFVPVKADLVHDLKDRARIFLKLDLAYLAAALAVITAFKIGSNEFTSFAAKYSFIAFSLLALGAFDALMELLVFNIWFEVRTDSGRRYPLAILRALFSLQILLHFAFAGNVLTYAVALSQGYEEEHQRFEGRVLLQDAVETHIRINGRVPKSQSELEAAGSDLSHALKKLQGEKFTIDPVDKYGYKITFAGSDGKFGTTDDLVFTHAMRMREVYERMEQDRIKSALDRK